ncbi:MAG: C1 family peptidase [Mycoplasmataceae bacterium]|nr:C1 family peptidase [Mycoplasmataceae bacterium]
MKKLINNCAPSDLQNKDWALLQISLPSSLPQDFSRRDSTTKVINQGSIGSCVGQALRVVNTDNITNDELDLSAMWIYKEAKKYDYWEGEDYSGTSISGACAALLKVGSCTAEFFPYNMNTENVEPKTGAIEDANNRKIKGYFKIPIGEKAKIQALLQDQSLAFSLAIHSKFYEAKEDGIVPTEGYFESPKQGGHAMTLVGWKEIEGVLHWEFQNSWGPRWGDKGHVYISAEVCEKAAISDCYYLVQQGEQKRNIMFGENKKKVKKALLLKFVHKLIDSVLKLFGKNPKFEK